MPAGDPDDLFERMKARVRAGGGSRSKLSVWMAERQDQIAKLIATSGADWDGWSEEFIKDGLLQPPVGWGEDGPDGAAAKRRAAETARMTWARLQKRKKGKAAPLVVPAPAKRGAAPGPAAPQREPEGSPGERRLAAMVRDLDKR